MRFQGQYLSGPPALPFSCLPQNLTPLHWAAAGGHANVCALLLDRGASLEALDKHVLYVGLRHKHSDPSRPPASQGRAVIFGHRSELFVSCDFGNAQLRSTNEVLPHALTTPWVFGMPSGPYTATPGCQPRPRKHLCATVGPWGLTGGSRLTRTALHYVAFGHTQPRAPCLPDRISLQRSCNSFVSPFRAHTGLVTGISAMDRAVLLSGMVLRQLICERASLFS